MAIAQGDNPGGLGADVGGHPPTKNIEGEDSMYHSESEGSSALDELLDVTRDLKSTLGRLVEASRHLASEQVGKIRDGASSLLTRGKERAGDVVSGTSDYVKDEPVKSLLVAVGAGLVLGYLISRSRD